MAYFQESANNLMQSVDSINNEIQETSHNTHQISSATNQTASNVQSLASTTEEINHASQNLSTHVTHTNDVIQESIAGIRDSSGFVSQAIEEQSSLAHDIAYNMQHASTSIKHINHTVSDISSVTKDTKDNTNNMRESVKEVIAQSNLLNTQIHEFLNNISNES